MTEKNIEIVAGDLAAEVLQALKLCTWAECVKLTRKALTLDLTIVWELTSCVTCGCEYWTPEARTHKWHAGSRAGFRVLTKPGKPYMSNGYWAGGSSAVLKSGVLQLSEEGCNSLSKALKKLHGKVEA